MSLILIEGFGAKMGFADNSDVGSLYSGKYDLASMRVSASRGRHGYGAAGNLSNNATFMLLRKLSAAEKDDVLVMGCALGWMQNTLIGPVFGGDSAGVTPANSLSSPGVTTHLTFVGSGSSPNTELAVYRGTSAGTLLGTTSGAGLNINTLPGGFRFIEIAIKLHDSAGYVHVWSDGVQVLDLNGIDTRNGGTDPSFDWFGLGTGSNSCDYDDLYLLNEQGSINNERLGDCRVLSNNPTSDSLTSWTPSAGTDHYALVDDLSNSSYLSDYLTATADDLVDTFGFPDASPALTATERVIGIGVNVLAIKSDTGARSIALVCRNGGASAVSPDQPLSNLNRLTAYSTFETDPNTGSGWTEAGHNSAEIGIKSRP